MPMYSLSFVTEIKLTSLKLFSEILTWGKSYPGKWGTRWWGSLRFCRGRTARATPFVDPLFPFLPPLDSFFNSSFYNLTNHNPDILSLIPLPLNWPLSTLLILVFGINETQLLYLSLLVDFQVKWITRLIRRTCTLFFPEQMDLEHRKWIFRF